MYESIVFKPEDFLRRIQIKYWESNTTRYASLYKFKNWYKDDRLRVGRCFTLTPSDEIIKKGIRMISFYLFANSTIFLHTRGLFLHTQQTSRLHTELGKWYSFKIKYDVHDVLDYGGESCYIDNTNTTDLCVDKLNQRKQLEKVGCTWPFGFNKTNICTKEDQGKYASINHNPK